MEVNGNRKAILYEYQFPCILFFETKTESKSMLFKKCPTCGFEWPTRDAFLAESNLELIGYQARFEELTAGLFLFNHSCLTTLAVPAASFHGLYCGPVFAERATGTQQCPGYCLYQDELAPCTAHCECAYVREILQIIKAWPKQQRGTRPRRSVQSAGVVSPESFTEEETK